MLNKKEIGKLGENIAVKYLKKKGYKILARNFEKRIDSLKFGEIDIIAQKDETIVFCEIKTKGFFPEQKINFKKIKRIARTAEIWLDENNALQDTSWQIDVLAITLDFNSRKAKVKHFKNV